jgi:sugar phosphate permease
MYVHKIQSIENPSGEGLKQAYAEVTPIEAKKLNFWRVSTFWVCLIGYMGYYLCRANLPAAFPLLNEAFHYSNSQLGLIAALSEASYALGKFTMGPYADRSGGRTIFLVGMLGGVVFNLIFAFCNSLVMFIIVWCLCRYFLSMGWGGLTKMIGNWYPPERNGTIMGFISINFQFGGVLGTVYAGYLVGLKLGWQYLFIVPALTTALVLLWSYLSSREYPRDVVPGVEIDRRKSTKTQVLHFENTEVKTIIMGLLKLPLFQKLLAFAFISQMLRSFFFFWTAKFLADIGMGKSNAIFSSALFPLFGCIGTIWLGWYTDNRIKGGDRARPMWIMLLGLAACLGLLTALVSSADPTQHFVEILILLCASGFLLLAPYSMSAGALTLDIAGPQGAGTSSGLLDGVGYVAGALATLAAGVMSDRLGWSQVFLFLGLSSLIAALAAYLMSREFRRRMKI